MLFISSHPPGRVRDKIRRREGHPVQGGRRQRLDRGELGVRLVVLVLDRVLLQQLKQNAGRAMAIRCTQDPEAEKEAGSGPCIPSLPPEQTGYDPDDQRRKEEWTISKQRKKLEEPSRRFSRVTNRRHHGSIALSFPR